MFFLDPKFVAAYSEFIKPFLQKFFFRLKWADGLSIFLLYFRNHVCANVDMFGSKKRHKRNIIFHEIYAQHSHIKARYPFPVQGVPH